ncbi:MAG: DUF2156 domain-containing protein, partial [Promethearchaeota archaeon]
MKSKNIKCYRGVKTENLDLANAKSIEISDKTLFNTYLQKFPQEISELTFTNLFMWCKHYDFLFMEWKEHLLIFSTDYLKKWKNPMSNNKNVIFFLPPIGACPDEIIFELFEELNNIEIHRVPDKISSIIEEKRNDLTIKIIEDRDNWDYVYKVEDLINLNGQKHRQNRRWLMKFLDEYNYKFSFLNENLIRKCRELQIKWCKARNCQKYIDIMEETNAINKALNNFSELDFEGGMLFVDDKCVAYTFGEKLNSNTLVIHIEKADKNYEGAYRAINNLFLKKYSKKVVYVNREQD